MKRIPTQLPKGARIYLPDEAARKRHVEEALLGIFERWGYREIVTPSFEYLDVLSTGTDQSVQERMFTFVDRETGKIVQGEVPPYSVVVPGTIEGKPIKGSNMPGPGLYCAVIVKQVDAQTRAKTSINELLRE